MKKINENTLNGMLKSFIESIEGEYTKYDLYNDIFMDSASIMEEFFKNYLYLKEGSSCCSDKASLIVSRIKKALLDKKNIVLTETYGEYQKRGNDIGGITELDNICYWCPKTIKDTDTALAIFKAYISFDMKSFAQLTNIQN